MKIKGIKKVVGEFNHYQGVIRIFFDMNDFELFTHCYASENDGYKYEDENIIVIKSKARLEQIWNKTSMKEIEKLCNDEIRKFEKRQGGI